MNKLIKNKSVTEDKWLTLKQETTLQDLESIPEDQAIIVPIQLWQQATKQLQMRSGPVGVALENTSEPENLADCLHQWPVVTIPFPVFTDGRGYSLARLLADVYHYDGEIRAVGDVLYDQLYLLSRCGFNAFEIRSDLSPEQGLNYLQPFSSNYQSN